MVPSGTSPCKNCCFNVGHLYKDSYLGGSWQKGSWEPQRQTIHNMSNKYSHKEEREAIVYISVFQTRVVSFSHFRGRSSIKEVDMKPDYLYSICNEYQLMGKMTQIFLLISLPAVF